MQIKVAYPSITQLQRTMQYQIIKLKESTYLDNFSASFKKNNTTFLARLAIVVILTAILYYVYDTYGIPNVLPSLSVERSSCNYNYFTMN